MGSVIKDKVCDPLSIGQDALAPVEKSRKVIPVVGFLILSLCGGPVLETGSPLKE